MGRIVSIANQKGGVGKTTTAINLAASLAFLEQKTLLIDFDPQGNCTSGLGIDRRTLDQGSYEVIIGQRNIQDVMRETALRFLLLVPATRDLIGAEVELVSEADREGRLKRALAQIQDRYDFLLIDCPPSLGLLTLSALTASESVLIPLQCEYFAMEGLTAVLDTIRRVRSYWNHDLRVEGILLTMFDVRNTLCHQVAEEVRQFFPAEVFRTVIPRNVRLSEAASHGKPALLYDGNSPGARSYLDLARELLSPERGKE
jgi:chromosome partitioning protein